MVAGMTLRARAEMHQPDPAVVERLRARTESAGRCQHPWALVMLIVTVDDEHGRTVLAQCACGEKLQKPLRALSEREPPGDPGDIGRE